jgi:hypothetical protein
LKSEPLGDLLEARRVTLTVNMTLQVAENFALTLGQRHPDLLLIDVATE